MIAVEGVDIDISFLVRLRKFVEKDCIAGLCLVERGGAIPTSILKWS